ncbi:DUF2635 domain-containing protein [Acetobacteraceae bacterium]|nr:DUF2635 domain-containing protein [Acetobacteraceae bacterium]
MKLKPAQGRKVLLPGSNRELSKEGEEIGCLTNFWRKRIAVGDVEKVENILLKASPQIEHKEELKK